MIRVTINGQSIEVPAGTTVLGVARQAGIDIPTLCDHPSLKPYGGCRLCVVEVEGMRTLQASCTLPASNGMVIQTDTPKVRAAREFVLTLLFSERNHFCMYCQKTNGDCELQNAAYGEGMTHWPLQPSWKPYLVDASHPYFVLDNNRCILCRRCVRACDELVGNHTLALENRGASTLLVADYGLPIGESTCIRCGTCVQVCPTGALIDRDSAYLGKDTELEHLASVCVGCSVGCGVELVVRDNRLVRIDGDWAHPVNGGLLCEAGHYLPLEDDRQRLTTPLVRKNGSLEPATWEEAFAALAAKLAPQGGKNELAALASTRLSAEALYAFKELFAGKLGSSMVTGIEENFTTGGGLDVQMNSLEALKTSDCVVVLGADLAANHQVAGFFAKRSLNGGASLIVIDPNENGLDSFATYSLRPADGTDVALLKGLMSGILSLRLNRADLPAGFDLEDIPLAKSAQVTGVTAETLAEIGRLIATARQPVFVFGRGLIYSGGDEALATLDAFSKLVGAAAVINLKGKANSLAAHLYALDAPFKLAGRSVAFLALGDDTPSLRLAESLESIPFVAVQASYVSPVTERADVVLPVATWAEQEGHYLNLDGRLQEAVQAVKPAAAVRSNLEALTALAGGLGCQLGGEWQAELLTKEN
jgi:formate dehydrogenase major subunit